LLCFPEIMFRILLRGILCPHRFGHCDSLLRACIRRRQSSMARDVCDLQPSRRASKQHRGCAYAVRIGAQSLLFERNLFRPRAHTVGDDDESNLHMGIKQGIYNASSSIEPLELAPSKPRGNDCYWRSLTVPRPGRARHKRLHRRTPCVDRLILPQPMATSCRIIL